MMVTRHACGCTVVYTAREVRRARLLGSSRPGSGAPCEYCQAAIARVSAQLGIDVALCAQLRNRVRSGEQQP